MRQSLVQNNVNNGSRDGQDIPKWVLTQRSLGTSRLDHKDLTHKDQDKDLTPKGKDLKYVLIRTRINIPVFKWFRRIVVCVKTITHCQTSFRIFKDYR